LAPAFNNKTVILLAKQISLVILASQEIKGSALVLYRNYYI